MRAIERSLVDEVWRGVTTYSPGRAEGEAKAFLERQPHVAAFCRTVTGRFDANVQKAGLGLAFLLFKVMEASCGGPWPAVARERVMEAYEATTAWLEQRASADPQVFLRSVLGTEESPDLALSGYLLGVVVDADPGSAGYDAEVVASLFLLVKTLADALDVGRAA